MIERGLRKRIRLALREEFAPLGGRIVGQPASAETGPGRTDLYVLFRGRYVGLEIKTDLGKPAVRQIYNIGVVRKAGCHAWIVRSTAEAVAAVWYAAKGGSVSGSFDFGDLFKDPDPAKEVVVTPQDYAAALETNLTHEEIGAFLAEPEIQAAVERNGTAPAGDGAAIEPSQDYTLHEIVARLDRMQSALLELTLLIRDALSGTGDAPPAATSEEVANLLAEPASPVEPPKRTRTKRT